MLRRASLAVGCLIGLVGCSSDPECLTRSLTTDVACATSQDCIDDGLEGLTCLDGRCQRVCEVDADCDLGIRPMAGEEGDVCELLPGDIPVGYCEARVCRVGCPDQPCAAGETCDAGRCVLFAESFEPDTPDDVADLGQFGWNGLDKELPNRRTAIVFEGIRGCTLGDVTCAGVAADGQRFLSLQRQPTQAKGTAETDFTCRPCACCLACLFEPDGPSEVNLSSCPDERPSPLTCPAQSPARCNAVCEQCNACPDADQSRIGERLASCEQPPAAKDCANCITCRADTAACTTAQCPTCAQEPGGDACVQCVNANCLGSQACTDCRVCEEARDCVLTDPGSAECLQAVTRCSELGADGCFDAAVGYRRAQLTDDEQALVSPEIDLSRVEGPVILQFDHVPFDVGESYRPGIQGTDPGQWPVAPQQVRVELCGGACEAPASWVLGALDTGGEARVPAASRRNNGLLLGSQTALDWRAGEVRVQVPDALKTAGFRFRFVPDIDEDARLGIDRILLRRRP